MAVIPEQRKKRDDLESKAIFGYTDFEATLGYMISSQR